MKGFKFGLQPLLEHRERIEDEKERVLAVRQRAYDEARAELDRLNGEFRSHEADLRDRHGSLLTEELRLHYAHLQFLDRTIDAQIHAVAECRASLERARRELLVASKDRKVVDKLRERRHASYVAERQHREQVELDDANARRHGRRKAQP